MASRGNQQGWQEHHHAQSFNNSHISSKFCQKDKPLSILTSQKHSLQADMIFGWKPKLPSCPLLLKFPNKLIQKTIQLIRLDNLFKIAYKSKHFVSSIQVNQQYEYFWKYRSRYSLNIALIKQAALQQAKQQRTKSINQNIRNLNSQELNSLNQNSFNQSLYNKNLVQSCEYTFDSNFQSANLDLAVRIKPNQYDCFIRSDSNTYGHCNWYYFKVSNHDRIGQLKINICNIGKIKNLYSKGMKPYVLEQPINGHRASEWSQQPCYNVQFVQRICRYGSQTKQHQLQFTYNFSHKNSCVYFAYGIPYTYSRLQSFLKQISPCNKQILSIEKLCQSLGGLSIPLLKITNNISSQPKLQIQKKAIIVSARIHPGQSHSSFLVEGFIKELLKDQPQYNIIRDMFVVYVVPMINPDGVVVGNYRTSYSGKDLNRQFTNLNSFVFPEITSLHQFALDVRQKHLKGIQFYMDFHGHSSKKNLFAYGPQHSPKNIYFFKSRIFPKLIQDFHPIFSYQKSIFKVSQGKKKTARAHMLWRLNIPMVYTFEVSNGMYETKTKQNILLDSDILLQAGQAIIKGLFKYIKIQMKIPSKLLPKKVCRQNIKKRTIKSSKVIADPSIKRRSIKPKQSLIQLIYQNQIISDKTLYQKQKRIFSKVQNKEQGQNQQNQQDLKQFFGLIQQINNIKQESEMQGGSDSQSDEEDFTKQQTQKFFKNIQKQKLMKDHKVKNKAKAVRISKSKTSTKKITIDQSKTILALMQKQVKKKKPLQQDVIKQPKRSYNTSTYNTLPVTKNNKSSSNISSTLQRMYSKIGLKGDFQNALLKSSMNYQTEKVQKVPITQKSYYLQI